MGLFDAFKKKAKVEFSRNEDAIITLMLAIGSLDGDLDNDEIQSLIGIAQINRSLANASLREAFDVAVKYLKVNGAAQSAVDAFTYLPHELHATALGFACLVALADGVVTAEEESKLMELAQVSSLSEEEAQAVLNTSIAVMRSIH